MSEIQSRYFAPLLWILIRIWCKVIYSYQIFYRPPSFFWRHICRDRTNGIHRLIESACGTVS